jgi:hypothetical protein
MNILLFFSSGIVTALTNYINTTTYGFSNFIHMAFVMCKLLIMRVLVQRTPLMITSLLCQAIDCAFALERLFKVIAGEL